MTTRFTDTLGITLASGMSYCLGVVVDHVTISPGTLVTIITAVGTAAWHLNGRLTRLEQKIEDLPCGGPDCRKHKTK